MESQPYHYLSLCCSLSFYLYSCLKHSWSYPPPLSYLLLLLRIMASLRSSKVMITPSLWWRWCCEVNTDQYVSSFGTLVILLTRLPFYQSGCQGTVSSPLPPPLHEWILCCWLNQLGLGGRLTPECCLWVCHQHTFLALENIRLVHLRWLIALATP